LLRINSRPFTANPITVAYRGHFRDVAPGDCYEFRLLKPEERDRNENRTPAASTDVLSSAKAQPNGEG